MAFKLGYRVCVLKLVVLFCCFTSTNSNPLFRSLSCNPRNGLTGSANSVVIRVQRFVDISINFRRDKPRLLSTVHHTIANDGKMHFFGNNLKAKFYGREICLSAVKETVLNEKGADERRLYSCKQVCLEVGTQLSLVTNSSSGGRVWPGKECCVWSRETFFQLTLMAAGPRCLNCQGRECLQGHVTTKQCSPGDKCFAITLNQQRRTAETNSRLDSFVINFSQ